VGPTLVTDEVEVGLARLAEIVPEGLSRGVFLNTGSEAVELGLKMACAATGRSRVAVVERSYFGATMTALGLSEAGRTAEFVPKPDGLLRLPAPWCSRCLHAPCDGSFPCLAPLEQEVDSGRARSLAAVLYEPVLANGGVIVPSEGYGARLRELVTAAGALLVADEVTTGIGRTGQWFGVEHDGIVPDVLVIGKAIGAGLPVAAVVSTAEVEECCSPRLMHVQSHQNDPFSGRVAATVIDILQRERLVERAAERGAQLLAALEATAARCSEIREVRGRGLMIGVELTEAAADRGPQIAAELLADGYLVSYQTHNRAFRLFPPYVISSEEIERFVADLERVLGALCRMSA
jgi:4-aminobutyrate aminotransferase-like enzyme